VLDEFLTFQSAVRSLSEAVIFTGSGQVCPQNIHQVDILGAIISESSSFARLPKPSFSRTDLKELAEYVLLLHTQAYPFIQ